MAIKKSKKTVAKKAKKKQSGKNDGCKKTKKAVFDAEGIAKLQGKGEERAL
jgi:hypothetical protein